MFFSHLNCKETNTKTRWILLCVIFILSRALNFKKKEKKLKIKHFALDCSLYSHKITIKIYFEIRLFIYSKNYTDIEIYANYWHLFT